MRPPATVCQPSGLVNLEERHAIDEQVIIQIWISSHSGVIGEKFVCEYVIGAKTGSCV